MHEPTSVDRTFGRVVVLGGGIGGLLAARALAEHAEEIHVLDRDTLAGGASARACVPQGRHVHAFLARGVAAVESLLPGVLESLVDRGGITGDALAHVRWCPGGVRFARTSSDLRVLFASRPLIEAAIRERVVATPGVRLRAEQVGIGLLGDRGGVRGVVVADEDGKPSEIEADLVVDATGRSSRSSSWLEALGLPPPPEDRIPVGVTYASVPIEIPSGVLGGDLAILCGATPAVPRSGVLHATEGGRAILSLGSLRGERPPRDWAGMLAHAATLALPDVADVARRATPLADVATYRVGFSVRRRHDLAPLRGYLPLGDALCAFNPVYAQGMSIAAIAAEALREACRSGENPSAVPQRYFAKIERDVSTAWGMGVAADLRFPWVEGRRTLRLRAINRWIGLVQRAAAVDPAVARGFVRVASLVDGREALLARRFVRRVLGAVYGAGDPQAPTARLTRLVPR